MINKKAQIIEQLQSLIPILVAIGLVLVIGILIVAQARTQGVQVAPTGTFEANESVAAAAMDVYRTLTYSGNSMELQCSAVFNDSGAAYARVPSDLYNCNTNGLRLLNGSNASGTLKVEYTHKNTSFAYNASNQVTRAVNDIPGWIPIIVVTFVGILLLGLVKLFRR